MLFFLIGWSALLAGSVIILLAFLQYFVAGRLAAVQKVCAVSFSFVLVFAYYLRQRRRYMFLPVFVCVSVC